MITRRTFLGTMGAATALAAMPTARALGANDRIRIALVGCGDRGMQDLRDALKESNIEIVAAADAYTRRLEMMKEKYPNIKTYDDPLKLLENKDVDAVINATPLHLHAKYFLATLQAGKDLYSEKTMAYNIADATACRNAAKASKQVVQIGMQHESEGELRDVQDWVKSGKLGKLTMVEAWMSRNTPRGKGQWVRPIPEDCNPDHVRWDLFLANRPKSAFDANKFINWRLFWEFSGGNITENMVHQIAWIATALDLDVPAAAYCAGGVFSEKDGRQVPDTIAVTLEYPNDLTVLWQSTFSNARYGLGEHYLGSNGTIEHVSGSTGMVTGSQNSRGGTKFMPEKANDPSGVVIESTTKGVTHMGNWFDAIRSRSKDKVNATVEVGYRSSVASFMSNLAYRRKARVTFEDAKAAAPDALYNEADLHTSHHKA
ncbi:Gfo/Idh/MocA family protein [Terriglobus roseus]|uniref:Predicted dehydrogenase n=1 Tax=Terriglobus roseus TaxID=392734 RepID=A0A1G7P6S8_9BACT|nr:Gfo/Idh/MocA family oxidoreductase [Terriglobus roseus]SDF81931.1 Predicted dehydrogenase [Terriglobus roseus]